ncbi:MAG: hypothetical protein ACR2PI_02120 [Hyphomicrobiaceae bacterium]
MSELHANSRSRGSSLFWPIYMLSWALLAGGALTYLSLSSLPTPGLSGPRATPLQSTPESNRAELDRAQLTAQVESLNKTVASLRSEMARLKSARQISPGARVLASDSPVTGPTMPAPAAPTSDITTSSIAVPNPAAREIASEAETARLTDDNTPSSATPSAETDAAGAPRQPQLLNSTNPVAPAGAETARTETTQAPETKPRRRRNLATSPLRPGHVPPLPPYPAQQTSQAPVTENARESAATNPQSPKLLSQVADAIKTSSLPVPTDLKPQPAAVVKPPPSQPVAFGTPTVRQHQVKTSPAALSLSTAQSVTGLRASWLLLTSRHPETFGGYQPRYVADQVNGTYRLIAGPILNHAEADRICNELRAQSVSCGVTSYIGSALR